METVTFIAYCYWLYHWEIIESLWLNLDEVYELSKYTYEIWREDNTTNLWAMDFVKEHWKEIIDLSWDYVEEQQLLSKWLF